MDVVGDTAMSGRFVTLGPTRTKADMARRPEFESLHHSPENPAQPSTLVGITGMLVPHENTCATKRKPFDVLIEGLYSEASRGDRI